MGNRRIHPPSALALPSRPAQAPPASHAVGDPAPSAFDSLQRAARLGHHIARIPISSPRAPGPGVVQRVQKQGPGNQGLIDVVEDDFLPNCVMDLDIPSRVMYRRSGGITSGWNDTDLFYADGDGPLVQITTAMVDAYWNPKYDGFDQLSGPDWTVNCEDYAKAGGFGDKLGDYNSKQTLAGLIATQRSYVLQLSYHWMRVAKTGDDAVTLQQKDGESAVYKKDFSLQDALTYILAKRGAGGSVFKNS